MTERAGQPEDGARAEEQFPTDETTLTLLEAACKMNPDSGQTHLQDFLNMGSRVKEETQIEWSDPPVYLIEYEEGYRPWSEHEVIVALIAEIRRFRSLSARAGVR